MALYPINLFNPSRPFGSGPNDPFMMLHREMNRLFDDVARGGATPAGGTQNQGGMMISPQMDVSETDKEVHIEAELPGVLEKDIEVNLNEDVLTIRAEKRQENKKERHGVHFSERSFGSFQRSLRLPFPIEPDQVQARFENGVLSVTLPKTKAQERNRRIPVKSTQQQGGDSQRAEQIAPSVKDDPSAVGMTPSA